MPKEIKTSKKKQKQIETPKSCHHPTTLTYSIFMECNIITISTNQVYVEV